jgi:hypothetical protein
MMHRRPTHRNALVHLAAGCLLVLWAADLFAVAMEAKGTVRCWSTKDNPTFDLVTLCFESAETLSGAEFSRGHGIDFSGTYDQRSSIVLSAESGQRVECRVQHPGDGRLELSGCRYAGSYEPIPPLER